MQIINFKISIGILLILINLFIYINTLLLQNGYFKHNYNKKKEEFNYKIFILFTLAFFIRILFAMSKGYISDISCFKGWAIKATKGLTNFYSGEIFVDYPPGYIYILWLIGTIKSVFHLSYNSTAFLLLIKLPAIIADILGTMFILKLALKKLNMKVALFLAGVYAFNPAVIINSAVWGQVDAVFTLFIVLSLYYLMEDKLNITCIYYVIAVLFKPQALIFAPVLFFVFIEKKSIKLLLKWFLIGITVLLISIIPFSIKQDFFWIFKQYISTLNSYPYASLNAFNLYTLFAGNWVDETKEFIIFSYKTWGFVFIILTVTYAGWIFIKIKNKTKIWYSSLFIIVSIFITSTKMHERYLFPALILALICYIYTKNKNYIYIYLGLSSTQFINTAYVLHLSHLGKFFISNNDFILRIVSLINIVLLGYIIKTGHNMYTKNKYNIKINNNKNKMVKTDYIYILILTIIYSFIAFHKLGNFTQPQTFYLAKTQNESFYIDFIEPQQIDYMTYYTGVNKGQFIIAISNDAHHWTRIGLVEQKSVFLWDIYFIKQTARYVKIIPQSLCSLGEIAFYKKGNTTPITIGKITANDLNSQVFKVVDEQSYTINVPSYMNSTYFDEIYHARTAYEYLHYMRPYEWTHPPLGKLLISIGIKIFGMTPFGWRIMGTIFGVLMIPLMYAFGKKIFQNIKFAFLVAFLVAFDGMHFVQTRIATVDVYLVFFVITMYYFMYYYLDNCTKYSKTKYEFIYLGLSGLFFGLGIAVKWTGLYAGFGLAIIFFYGLFLKYNILKKTNKNKARKVLMKDIILAMLFFVIIPIVIYILSYFPELFNKDSRINNISDIFTLQKNMYYYHKNIQSSHPFASKSWTWPLLIKPVWYYSGRYGLLKGKMSSILLIGNPIIWWLGILAVIYIIYHSLKWKDKEALFLTSAIFSQYLPYAFIHREMFLYHFFPILPFIILSIVYMFKNIQVNIIKKNYKKIISLYMFVVIIVFFMFYPVLSGMTIDKKFAESCLRWFSEWYFIP